MRALSKDVGRLLKALEKNEKTWDEVRQSRVSPNERHILAELEKDVSLKIKDAALIDVVQDLSKTHGLNVVLDNTGLEEEGITEKTPISFNVTDVKLKNVLKLILEPMQLTYQVRDDVIVITSKLRAQGKMVVTTYPVADLVIPIPTTSPDRADQIAPAERKNKNKTRKSEPLDFDTLIATILTTIQPDSWDENGGPASMRAFKPNLSLVIRQTKQAHEEIADLLEQLRQLQDMQVTLESRFLDNLPDRFFERLGVDLDFKAGSNQALVSSILLTDRQFDLLLQATQDDDRANLTELPKVTMWNGQGIGIDSFFVGNKQHPLKLKLHMQPVISADRRNVRLNLRVSDPKSPSTKSQHFVNKIPDGQAFLIEIGRGDKTAVGVPVHTKTPSADRLFTRVRRTNGRRFLLIRPRIVIQKEEEELLGISLEN